MQKKIVALAVAGLMSGAAFAQSNVTIYGNVDVGYRGASTSGGPAGTVDREVTAIDSNPWTTSRIGFRGEEALGDGLKALFVLEYALAPDTNTGIGTMARQSYIGLAGEFGSVVAGRLQPMAKALGDRYKGMDANNFNAMDNVAGNRFSATQAGADTTLSGSTRLNNAVAYTTPNMSGFTAQVAYSFAGASGPGAAGDVAYNDNDEQERILGLAVDYVAGPLTLSAVYHRVSDLTNTVGAANEIAIRDYLLGAQYDFGVAKARIAYLSNKSKNDRGNVALNNVSAKDSVWTTSVDVPVTASGTAYVAYARLNSDSDSDQSDAKSWSLGYKHVMSKRTFVYGGYAKVSNDDISGAQITSNTGTLGLNANTRGQDVSGFTFGLNHAF